MAPELPSAERLAEAKTLLDRAYYLTDQNTTHAYRIRRWLGYEPRNYYNEAEDSGPMECDRLADALRDATDRLATAEVALAAARRLVLVCSTDGATFSPACRRCPSCELAHALAALDAGAAPDAD